MEAARVAAVVERVVIAPDLLRSETARHAAESLARAGAETLEVSADVFATLSNRDGPQGIGVVVRQRWERLDQIDPPGTLSWVALGGLRDPGNVGTILRSGDGAGASGAIILGSSADPYDPAGVRASMGAIFTQRLVRATFPELRRWCSQWHAELVATSDRGTIDYRQAAYSRPVVVLAGRERQGLSDDEMSGSDLVVRIPMSGHADSLNVAVAASLVLYEVWYQHNPVAPAHD